MKDISLWEEGDRETFWIEKEKLICYRSALRPVKNQLRKRTVY